MHPYSEQEAAFVFLHHKQENLPFTEAKFNMQACES